MEKYKLIFQVQGKDDEEWSEWEFIEVIEKKLDAESDRDLKVEELRQQILKSLKDKKDKDYNCECILIFDSKGNEVYRDEETIHYDMWGYMEDGHFDFKIKRTPEED